MHHSAVYVMPLEELRSFEKAGKKKMATPKRRKPGGEACSAIKCSNARWKAECAGMSFFRFPKEETRCRIWVQNSRRDDLIGKTGHELNKGGYLLCSKHFEPNQFNRPAERNHLTWNAIPTLFDVPNPPPSVTTKRPAPRDRSSSACSMAKKQRSETAHGVQHTMTDGVSPVHDNPGIADPAEKAASASTLRLVKKKLKKTQTKVSRLQKKLLRNHSLKKTCAARKEALAQELYEHFPAATANFIKTQLRVTDKHKKGRRWSEEDKTLALSLYHSSRKAYKLLMKIFTLPSIHTLRRTVQSVKIYPGFNDNLLRVLAQKIQSMPPNAPLCTLVFDEMTIKEKVEYNIERDEVEGFEDFGYCGKTNYIANHACVFLVRGLIYSWKQPVGYFLSSGPINSSILHALLIECLDKLAEAMLNVKCIIADQGSNNRAMFSNLLKVSEKEPFFVHNGNKIHVLYDPPHLLKNVRNNLKKNGFTTSTGNISWKHVVDFYHFEQQSPIRMAPRLTKKHVTLPPFSALSVKYAAQLLSHSVAVGISFMARYAGDKDGMETAEFIEHFDCLFNCFNSCNLHSKQKMGHAMSDDSGHVSFLQETLGWLENVKSAANQTLPCLSGWRMAIRTLLSLWADLKDNHQIKFLMTSKLNQDCVENLFSRIRGNMSHVDRPSAAEFRVFIRRAMVDHLFLHSSGSNCVEDMDQFVLTLGQLGSGSANHNPVESVDLGDAINQEAGHHNFEEVEFQSLLIKTPIPATRDSFVAKARDSVLTYISGYIAKKLQPKMCMFCQTLLTGELTGSDDQMFLVKKQLSDCVSGLVVPSNALVHSVKQLEDSYCKNIESVLHVGKVMTRLSILLGNIGSSTFVCSSGTCDLNMHIIKLFCNIRVHFTLKDKSLNFQDKNTKRNRKVLKFSNV